MIGFFGGSFDPVHQGHIELVRKLLEKYPWEKVLLCPAKQNPLKENLATTSLHRWEMLKLAVAFSGEKRLVPTDMELTREGPSYTVTTLEHLQSQSKDICIILGNEVFQNLSQWHQPKRLLELTNIVVVNRVADPISVGKVLQGCGIDGAMEAEGRFQTKNGGWVDAVEIETLPVSSSQIREEIAAHPDFPTQPQGLQRVVWDYIKENRLYAVK